ncbi:hypothetical protein QE152_g35640 [Popillia japonica]|uniref:Ribosomal protein S7 n=1 Tax=Popillia japonica TaxID=7064 RepID=A0AAW1IFI9_POPJA
MGPPYFTYTTERKKNREKHVKHEIYDLISTSILRSGYISTRAYQAVLAIWNLVILTRLHTTRMHHLCVHHPRRSTFSPANKGGHDGKKKGKTHAEITISQKWGSAINIYRVLVERALRGPSERDSDRGGKKGRIDDGTAVLSNC